MSTSAFAAGAYASTAKSLAAAGAAKPPAVALGGAQGNSFASLVTKALDGAAETGQRSDAQGIAAIQGKADIVDVVTAVAESEAAIETLVAVRDRVIAAYEEIMRMPI